MNPVWVRRFDFGYNRMTFRRGPYAIESDGVGCSLVPTIVNFEVESTAKLVNKILQYHPAFSEVGGKAAVHVFPELRARHLGQIRPEFSRAFRPVFQVAVTRCRDHLLDRELIDRARIG